MNKTLNAQVLPHMLGTCGVKYLGIIYIVGLLERKGVGGTTLTSARRKEENAAEEEELIWRSGKVKEEQQKEMEEYGGEGGKQILKQRINYAQA
ncbi:hypothetical protein RUM44_000705 [Polyplax serrata]|uniref:Uncharacterized protein n=1 Tax=Polyplax serrata TaxID=468196 RepID=A0ABR1B8E7_POLSC